MALTPEQRRNAQILRSATNRPIIAKAILEAGLVESGLRHLPYGDRDSVGILQQRPSQGWGPAGESVATDASQFVRAANRVLRGGFRGSAAQLAQKVQRSGFPERYGQRSGEAEGLLRSLVGPQGGSSGGSTPVTLTAQVPTTENSFDPGQGSDLSALAGLLQQPQAPPPVQAPQAPNSSQRYLSSAGTSPVVAPPPPQQDNLGALLTAIQSPGQDLPEAARGSETVSVSGSVPNAQASGGSGSGVHGSGTVRVSPSANRSGVGLTPGIMKVVRAVAAQHGSPLTIGTGTNHSHLTTNGRVSEHWEGNAADIPSAGRSLIRLGQDALIAAGMPERQARRQSGGLYNLPYGRGRRIQIIFGINDPARGGDHTDHLHVGVSALGQRGARSSSQAGRSY